MISCVCVTTTPGRKSRTIHRYSSSNPVPEPELVRARQAEVREQALVTDIKPKTPAPDRNPGLKPKIPSAVQALDVKNVQRVHEDVRLRHRKIPRFSEW